MGSWSSRSSVGAGALFWAVWELEPSLAPPPDLSEVSGQSPYPTKDIFLFFKMVH
jgi:hypothetical protein